MDEHPNILRRKQLRHTGFTLIELVIVVLIVGGLVTIGVPMMGEMIANQKVRGAANELYMDLSFARSEAIKRNATVDVVRTGANWTEGWTLQVAGNVIRVQTGTKGISASNANPATLSFEPNGRPKNMPAALSFNFSSSSSVVTMRCVSVTPSGRPAVRIDRNRDGVDCDD